METAQSRVKLSRVNAYVEGGMDLKAKAVRSKASMIPGVHKYTMFLTSDVILKDADQFPKEPVDDKNHPVSIRSLALMKLKLLEKQAEVDDPKMWMKTENRLFVVIQSGLKVVEKEGEPDEVSEVCIAAVKTMDGSVVVGSSEHVLDCTKVWEHVKKSGQVHLEGTPVFGYSETAGHFIVTTQECPDKRCSLTETFWPDDLLGVKRRDVYESAVEDAFWKA